MKPEQPQDAQYASPTHMIPGRDVDWSQARQAVENHDQILLDIIRIFVEECPRWLSEIDEAVVANDFEGVWHCAHSLKGAASTIAALPLAEAAADLERSAHAGPTAEVATLRDRVRTRSESLMLALGSALREGRIPENPENAH